MMMKLKLVFKFRLASDFLPERVNAHHCEKIGFWGLVMNIFIDKYSFRVHFQQPHFKISLCRNIEEAIENNNNSKKSSPTL